jgi:hypothetical protein
MSLYGRVFVTGALLSGLGVWFLLRLIQSASPVFVIVDTAFVGGLLAACLVLLARILVTNHVKAALFGGALAGVVTVAIALLQMWGYDYGILETIEIHSELNPASEALSKIVKSELPPLQNRLHLLILARDFNEFGCVLVLGCSIVGIGLFDCLKRRRRLVKTIER